MGNIKNLLILRPDGIGDCVLFSGTLKYYRQLYPDYRITLAVKKHIIPLFENSEFVDEVIGYEQFSYIRQGKSKYMQKAERIIKELRKIFIYLKNKNKKWYIIIYPVRSITNEILWVINSFKSNEKIGIIGCSANFPVNKMYKAKKIFTKYYNLKQDEIWQHELITNFKFLQMLGANMNSINDIFPNIKLNNVAKDSEILKKYNLNEYIILAAFGSSNIKSLTNDICDKIIKRIKNISNILIVGTKEFHNKAEILKNFINHYNINIVNLCGQTNLNELLVLIKDSNFVISTDTSILHFSIMLNKKVYAVVGGGHWGRFFPWGDSDNVIWLNNKMDCYQCNWRCKYYDFRCIGNINYDKIT